MKDSSWLAMSLLLIFLIGCFGAPTIALGDVITGDISSAKGPIPDGRFQPPLPANAEKTQGPPPIPETRSYQRGAKYCQSWEKYSNDRWQWAKFETCREDKPDPFHQEVTFSIVDAQYYWGAAWYRFKGTEDSASFSFGANRIGVQPYALNTSESFGTFTGPSATRSVNAPTTLSGSYKIGAYPVSLRLYWGGDASSNVYCLDCEIDYMVANTHADSRRQLENAISRATSPIIYRFDANFRIPVTYDIYGGGGNLSMGQDAYLVVIPNAAINAHPFLFGDKHTGDAARCENNANAVTADGTRQDAEMYAPGEMLSRLGNPDMFFNANYFDVRPQRNGQTWQQSLCSVPLGLYFDNDPNGPTGGTHNSPNRFFPGPRSFIASNGATAPVDTALWTRSNRSDLYFNIVKNSSIESTEAFEQARLFDDQGENFIGISGTALLYPSKSGGYPDSGNSDTTRIGIGYDRLYDRLYILIGGTYRGGFRRVDLEAVFRTLDLLEALELDGGGSAALGIRRSAFQSVAAPLPASSCANNVQYWCTPITQPSGQARPVPSWVGINLK